MYVCVCARAIKERKKRKKEKRKKKKKGDEGGAGQAWRTLQVKNRGRDFIPREATCCVVTML